MRAVITADWLVDHLDDPELVVLEVSLVEATQAAYYGCHVPRSRFAYWKDLLWHERDREFATSEVLAERLGALGVRDDSTLVLVGDPIQFATYAYWVLTMSGLAARATVLDGGRAGWLARNLPVSLDVPTVEPGVMRAGTTDPASRIGRDDVLAGLGRDDRVVLDLRSHEEYVGERVAPLSARFDHGAERRGRIPGARHLPVDRLLRDNGAFTSAVDLEAVVDDVGIDDGLEVVTYCRLGHRASLGWFALTKLLGRERVRVYDGSWTEWGSIVGVPVER